MFGAAVAYGAEHPTNPGFATYADALWWGVVTLTTVGYGDIVPKTTTGRVAGVIIMFTGVGVLGLLAGSLASFFRIDTKGTDDGQSGEVPPADPLTREISALKHQIAELTAAVAGLAPSPDEPES